MTVRLLPLSLLAVLSLGLPRLALAQEDDDLDDFSDLADEEEEQVAPEAEAEPEGIDDQETYDAYKADLRGEAAAEELDAWKRYLEVYPQSLFRLQIEKRIGALEEAAYSELDEDPYENPKAQVDAKRMEMDLKGPALLSLNPNPRRNIRVGALWGYSDYLNFDLGFEWAFLRQLSAWGAIRHTGRGFGGVLQLGAKYALVKDVRTGIILTGAFALDAGGTQLDRLLFAIEPIVGFGWLISDKLQLSTSVDFWLRLDRFHFQILWDLMLVVRPSKVVGIYVESKMKHSSLKGSGIGTQYLGFQQAGVGVKVNPTPNVELTVGANVPYGWRLWKDYLYFGIHAGLTFYLDKKPE